MLFSKKKKAKRDAESRAATLTLQRLIDDDAFEFAENDNSNDDVPAVVEERDFFGGAPAPEDLYPDTELYADVLLGMYDFDDNNTVEPPKKKEPNRRQKNPAKNGLFARVKKKERPPKKIRYEQTPRLTTRSMTKEAAATSSESSSARAKNEHTPGSNEAASAQSSTRAEPWSDPVDKKERPKKIVKYEQTPRMTTRSMVKAAAALLPVKKRGRPKKNVKNEPMENDDAAAASNSAEPVKKKRRTKNNVGGAPTPRLTTRSMAKAAAASVEPSSAHVIDSSNVDASLLSPSEFFADTIDMNEPQALSTDDNPFVNQVADEGVDESEFVVGQIYTDGSGIYALYNGECFVQVDPSQIEATDPALFSSSDASNEESYCPLSNSDTVSEEEMNYYDYEKPLNEVFEQPQQNDYMIMPTTVDASSFNDNFLSPASTILDTAEEYKQPKQEEEINDEGFTINFNSSEGTDEGYDSFDPYNQPTCNPIDESFNAFNLFGRENAADLLDLAFGNFDYNNLMNEDMF